jgi:Fe-S-cluster containining protein
LAPDQDCKQCGKCCEKWGWRQKGAIDDIIPWITHGRRDILQHVGIRFNDTTQKNERELSLDDIPRVTRIDYWVSIEGRKVRHCPFFFRADDGKVWCRIHDAGAKVCIRFTPWDEGICEYALNCPACRENAP